MWSANLHLEVLSEEQVEAIHEHALALLEEIGFRVGHAPLLELLRKEGLDADGDLVRLDRHWISEKVALAPRSFTIHARNPDRSVDIGGNRLAVAPTGGQPFVLDPAGVRRPATMDDYATYMRLSQAARNLHVVSSGIVETQDLPVASRHLDMDLQALRLADKPYTPVGATATSSRDCVDLAAVLFGGREAIEREPVMMGIVNPVSPLQFDDRMGGSLYEYALGGQCVIIMPYLLAGATSPFTIAGSVAQATAESLAGVAFVQTVRPGTPTIFGTYVSEIDLHGGGPIFGTAGAALGILAAGQMARRVGIPFRSGGAFTNQLAADPRAIQESLMSLWPVLLSGPNFILHAAGWIEGSLAISYEKFALDLDVLDVFERVLQGDLPVDEGSLAMDAFREVGPGNTFLGAAHTLRAIKGELPTPIGSHDWKRMLEDHEDPPLDPGVDEALREFVAQRRSTIERGAA